MLAFTGVKSVLTQPCYRCYVVSCCFGFSADGALPSPPLHPVSKSVGAVAVRCPVRLVKKLLRFINPIWWWMWNCFNSPSDKKKARDPSDYCVARTILRAKKRRCNLFFFLIFDSGFSRVLCLTRDFPPWSLQPVCPWKWMVGRWTFLLGRKAYFQGG